MNGMMVAAEKGFEMAEKIPGGTGTPVGVAVGGVLAGVALGAWLTKEIYDRWLQDKDEEIEYWKNQAMRK